MDKVLLDFWRKLKPGDTFYVIGDISMSRTKAEHALDQVPKGVQVHYVFGNHDSRHRKAIERHPRVVWSGDLKGIKIEGQYIVLCHYAMRVWNMSHHGAWQLFGHSHDGLYPWENQLDVGVDSAANLVGEYRPLSFEEIAGFISDSMNPRLLAKQFGGKSPSWVGGDHHDLLQK
jgi:calcineurin-like phosphoesterase family protein